MKTIPLIGFASGIAASNSGCADGPLVLQKSSLFASLSNDEILFQWHDILLPAKKIPVLPAVTQLCQKLAQHTQQLCQQNKFFLVFGGDHSSAMGTWSGVYGAKMDQGPIGLIWFDAHMDSHTPESSESGNIHGMPLASLLGYGDPGLTTLVSKNPKLLPQHVCIIGVRSFERGEAELIQRLGVRVYGMDEIQQRGIAAVFQEAQHIVQQGTVGYGISIDMDGFDPQDAPGVGTLEANGVSGMDFCQAIQGVAWDPKLLGMEFAEFNPRLDIQKRTEKMIVHLIHSAFCNDSP